jgi:transposase-like protein
MVKPGGMKLKPSSVRRRRFTAQKRSPLLEAFDRSPVRAAQFAARHGLGVSTLYAWRRHAAATDSSKLGPHRSPASPPEPFRQVSLAEVLGAGHSWAGEVCLADGTQLRWRPQAGLAAVHALLNLLRQPCGR